MAKFDPFVWREVPAGAEFEAPKGVTRVRCSAPGPLFVSVAGVQALFGVGTEFEVELSEDGLAVVSAPKTVRVFVLEPERTAFRPEGEVFTNIDRLPSESGAVAEVTRALRQLELSRRAAIRDIRAAQEEVEAERRAVEPDLSADADEVPGDDLAASDTDEASQ